MPCRTDGWEYTESEKSALVKKTNSMKEDMDLLTKDLCAARRLLIKAVEDGGMLANNAVPHKEYITHYNAHITHRKEDQKRKLEELAKALLKPDADKDAIVEVIGKVAAVTSDRELIRTDLF